MYVDNDGHIVFVSHDELYKFVKEVHFEFLMMECICVDKVLRSFKESVKGDNND